MSEPATTPVAPVTDGAESQLPSDPAIAADTGGAEGDKAALSTRAREDTPVPAITWRERCERLAAFFRPPEIWDRPRPPLKELWAYASEAPWTGQGFFATANKVYTGLVVIPITAALYWIQWMVQRYARALVGLLVLTVFALTPPGAWCRGALAAVLRFVADHVT